MHFPADKVEDVVESLVGRRKIHRLGVDEELAAEIVQRRQRLHEAAPVLNQLVPQIVPGGRGRGSGEDEEIIGVGAVVKLVQTVDFYSGRRDGGGGG